MTEKPKSKQNRWYPKHSLKIYDPEWYSQHIQEHIRIFDWVLILSHYSFKYIYLEVSFG